MGGPLIIRGLTALLVLALACPAQAENTEADEDSPFHEGLEAQSLAEYREALLHRFRPSLAAGSVDERTLVCRTLPYSGLDDATLFDALEKDLLRQHEEALLNGEETPKDVAFCVRALASSGNLKYRATIRKWVNTRGLVNRRMKRYVLDRADGYLVDSAAWNPIINGADNHKPGQSWAVTRTVNMLKSAENGLQREGLKRLKDHGAKFPWLYDLVETELLVVYVSGVTDPTRADTVAWMCKWLAQSGNVKYRATLQKVAAGTPSGKVRRHAEASLEQLNEHAAEQEERSEDS